jgi:hypothetical protein
MDCTRDGQHPNIMDRITDKTDIIYPKIKSALTHGTHHASAASRMDHRVLRWVKQHALCGTERAASQIDCVLTQWTASPMKLT